MGLVVKPTKENKITIQGTDIELDQLYVRVEFAGRSDGKTLEVAFSTYQNKEAFQNKKQPVVTTVQSGNFSVELQAEEEQGIAKALFYTKAAIAQQGFEVSEN